MEREGDIITRCTRGSTIRVSISGTDRCTQEMSNIGERVMSGGLRNPNPGYEVTSVVIHIYFLALHELFFTLAYLLFCISILFRKEK